MCVCVCLGEDFVSEAWGCVFSCLLSLSILAEPDTHVAHLEVRKRESVNESEFWMIKWGKKQATLSLSSPCCHLLCNCLRNSYFWGDKM